METAELRALFPEITDEAIAERQARAVETKRQSLRDRIANLEAELAALQSELEGLSVTVTEG